MTDSGQYDDATLARQKMAAALLGKTLQPEENIKHWSQGLANIAKAGVGGYMGYQAQEEARRDREQGKADLYAALGVKPAGGAPAVAPEAPSPPAPVTPPVAPPAAPVAPSVPMASSASPMPPPRAPVQPIPDIIRTNPDGTIAGNITSPTIPTPAGTKIAAALTAPPAGGPTDVSASAKPPAVATAPGIMAGISDEKKLQIAQMLASRNPQVKSVGQALMTQAMAASDTPKYDFKTAGDTLYRTNSRAGTADPVRDVGRSVQPMTAAQRKEWNVPEGMSAGIDDNGKPVFSPPGTNINLNTAQSGTKAMQEKSIEDYQAVQTASRDAVKRSQIWDQMEGAAKGFTPGATADVKLTAKRYLKDAGIIAGEDVPDAEVFKQMQQQIAIHAQPKGQGAVSNVERELFAKAIPNITMSPEGLSRSLQISRSLDNYDRKVAQVYRDNAKKNGGIPNSVEVNEDIEKLGSPLSVGDTNYLNKASKGEAATVPVPKNTAAPKIDPALQAEIERRKLKVPQ